MPQTGSIVLSGKGLQVVNAFLQSGGGGWGVGEARQVVDSSEGRLLSFNWVP